MSVRDVYAPATKRFAALLDGIEDDMSIAATPAWTARDLLGHVVGVAADIVAGNVDTYAQPSVRSATSQQ